VRLQEIGSRMKRGDLYAVMRMSLRRVLEKNGFTP
jgi:hypothetical protein